jgi:hypothetical protein
VTANKKLTAAQRAALDRGRAVAHERAKRRRELLRLEIRVLADYSLLTPSGRGQSRRIVEVLERMYRKRVCSEWTVRRILDEREAA